MTHLEWPSEPPRFADVVLREFTRADVPMVRDLATDPYVARISTLPAMATDEQAREWIRRQGHRLVDLIGYSFCIADAGTDEALGQVGLWSKELDEGRMTVGYYVAPRARGRHAAAKGLAAVTNFAWSLPQAHRLEAYVEPWNIASVRGVERCGYQREGLLRERQLLAGEHKDVLVYSRLRSDGPVRPFD